MTGFQTPTDGPDATLLRVVRLLKLPYSGANITRAVASHPRPNSLLALVEVATSLGIKTTPARVEPSALEELTLPAVVHFNGDGAGGFGVLESAGEDRVELWDSANGTRSVDRDEFLAGWSGIVALVELDEAHSGRGNYLLRRTSEVLLRSAEPPEISAGPSAPFLRVVVGSLLACLLASAVAAAPDDDRLALSTVILLSLVGLAASALAAVSVADQGAGLGSRICARGKLVDCQSVLTSQYSRIAGIPMTDLGVATFGAILLLCAAMGAARSTEAGSFAIGVVYVAAVPVSLFLMAAQIRMKQLCTLCLAVHVATLGSAALAWGSFLDAPSTLATVGPQLLLLALLVLSLLFVGVPYFRKSAGLSSLASRHGRIAGSPFVALAELLTETPTAVSGSRCAVPLGGSDATHEVVVFVHPSCSRCEPILREVRGIASRGLVAGFATVAPRKPHERERASCSAIVAAGLALGPDRFVDAYRIAKKHLAELGTGDPVEVIAAGLEVESQTLRERMEDARVLVAAAEEIADEHVEGTPAVFVDSRQLRAPLAQLEYLLDNHGDLVSTAPRRQG